MPKFRKKIVVGNWKMNKSVGEAQSLATDIKRELTDCREVDMVLCPPFTALKAVGDIVTNTSIKLGAQDMHWEKDGAYTGEISAAMLRDLYCHHVILGHSERRAYFHETDKIVNQKVKAAVEGNITPIVCVGETLKEREAGKEKEVVGKQMQHSLAGLEQCLDKIMVAYEPVWAIGTGKTATPQQAQEMHALIRQILAGMANEDAAQSVRIQYGGTFVSARY